MKKEVPPPRYSRAYQTGWDNSLELQEKPVTVTLTLDELDNLFHAALEAQVARRTDIDSMQADPDIERHEIAHFRAKLYRTKAVLDEVEKRMMFAEAQDNNSEEQGEFSSFDHLPSGF